MQNIDYQYVKMLVREREAGLRRAQLAGTAYEYRKRGGISWWPWHRSSGSRSTGATRVARAN
jgi:hypothetical protein